MVANLRKERKSWMQLSIILGREGGNPRVLGVLFKELVQAVLFLGLEMGVMTPRMGRALGGDSAQGGQTDYR